MSVLSAYQIRQGDHSDLPEISALENLSFKDPYPESLLSQLAENYPETFLVAKTRDSEIVGYAVAKRGMNRHHLLSIAVLPLRRRSGIGQQLLASLEERLGRG